MRMKKGLSILLSMLIVVTSMWSTEMVAHAEDAIIVAPENMLNVQVVDKDGNKVNNVNLSLLNDAGVECAAWKSNNDYFNYSSNYVERNDSGILVGDSFDEPRSTFEALVSPGNLVYIQKEIGYYDYWEDQYFTTGEAQELTLGYMPYRKSELSVLPNTVIINADKKWKKACHELYIGEGGKGVTVNSAAGSLTSLTNLPTECTLDVYGKYYGYAPESYKMKLDKTTEYVKVRRKLSDIDSRFNEDGTLTCAIETDTVETTVTLKIASGTPEPGEVYFHIISGAVINYPVPDDKGYIEFYVEKERGGYDYSYENHFDVDCGDFHLKGSVGGSGGSGNACEELVKVFKAIEIPSEGTTLNTVPAGEYTIKLSNVPSEYENPGTIAVTIEESQDIQYLKIVLEDAHTHSYGSEYKSDATNHWKECACGEKSGVKAHTPGYVATEDGVMRACTVCGYEIVPGIVLGDVDETSWQYKYVKYVCENGYMKGKDTDEAGRILFDPEGTLTRAEFVQVLYNVEGKPQVTYKDRFSDVPKNEWYTNAIMWATEKGIVSGYGNGEYGVSDPITREQLATMLYKYAQYKGYTVSATAELDTYSDISEISDWAVIYMKWIVGSGIMSGKGDRLDPQGDATRAECATLVNKFHISYGK